jgi:Fic family protein
MGEVVKKIRNYEYFYYQDRVKIDNKTKIITTQIGKSDLKEEELNSRRREAFKSHYKKLWDIEYENNRKLIYKFEYMSEKYGKFLIAIKSLYKIIRRFLSEEEFNLIDKERFNKHVYGTTHIEGNVVEYNDVIKILEKEKTPSNYGFNDVNEIHNYLLLKSYLSDKKKYTINENLIKKIHSLLLNGITLISITGKKEQIPLGKYRKEKAFLRGIPFRVSPPALIEQEIGYLIHEYNEKIKKDTHPLEAAIIFHQKFEEIHPFVDGNGRTGREILNFMLQMNGYPSIYITRRTEKRYYDALEKGNIQEYTSLMEFIAYRMFATVIYYWSKTSMYEFIKDNVLSISFDSNSAKELEDIIEVFNKENHIP